jgi:hypothetical protein
MIVPMTIAVARVRPIALRRPAGVVEGIGNVLATCWLLLAAGDALGKLRCADMHPGGCS